MHVIQRKNLSANEIEEVHKWLEANNINTNRLRRDFSDVLPVAELLKRYYPRLIDLYNYPKKNSVQLKIVNWETFNFKVLSKFNMSLNREMIEFLANGVHGAAEILLHELLRLEKRQRQAEERTASLRQEQAWEANDEVRTVVVNKQVGDGIVQVPQKMILYSLYETLLRECQSKDTLLDVYQQRLAHMENIVKMKSERIDELLMQMGRIPSKSVSNTLFVFSQPSEGSSGRIGNAPAPAPSAEN